MQNIPFDTRLNSYARTINAPYVQFLKRVGLAREFVRAERCTVYDAEGHGYIDCIAGYGNCNIGHNHPRVVEAVMREIGSERPFNLPFVSDAQSRLAERLAELAPGDVECSLVVNSGSEAVDSALKLARLVSGKAAIIAAHGAWHGFTMGAMSVSDPAMRTAFQPLLHGVTHVPYNDLDAVRQALNEQTGAVIVEPLQAESGAVVPSMGYLSALAQLCRDAGVILIFDEVKSGIGKTGTLFACQDEGAVPDIVLSGKSLGGGVMPIGAMTARRSLWGKLGYSFAMSSTSAGGNAAACAGALATLDVLAEEDLCRNAAEKGARLLDGLQLVASENPDVLIGCSGRGLLLALHAADAATAMEIVRGCIERRVLIMVAFGNRSRILVEPPLCVEDKEIDRILEALGESAAAVSARRRAAPAGSISRSSPQ